MTHDAEVLECVPNVSEGRRADVVERVGAAAGDALLDVHRDPDHHRSVFTLAGPSTRDAEAAARRLAAAAFDECTLVGHEGVHPRFGVVDVVPFVALAPSHRELAVAAATAFAEWVGDAMGVPAFLYGDADPRHRTLPDLRRDAFGERRPDHGPKVAHPTLGAVAVGARPALVALNCCLDRDDLALARRVASAVRARDGGLTGVRALGLRLASVGAAQVSLNVTRLEEVGVEQACTAVRDHVETEGARVDSVELVGLVPAAEEARWSDAFRVWSGLGPEVTIEARLASRAGEPGAR